MNEREIQDLHDAIELAHRIRAEHNGIMGVRLFMGHDGHNACHLDDYDGEIGRGDSGGGMLRAVQDAYTDRRFRSLMLINSSWVRQYLDDKIEEAVQKFGGQPNAVLNTACFQSVTQKIPGVEFSGDQVAAILSKHPRIIRLKGGCHWLRLPEDFEVYEGYLHVVFAEGEKKVTE